MTVIDDGADKEESVRPPLTNPVQSSAAARMNDNVEYIYIQYG